MLLIEDIIAKQRGMQCDRDKPHTVIVGWQMMFMAMRNNVTDCDMIHKWLRRIEA